MHSYLAEAPTFSATADCAAPAGRQCEASISRRTLRSTFSQLHQIPSPLGLEGELFSNHPCSVTYSDAALADQSKLCRLISAG
jgi:hypothetical protein